MKKLLLSLLLLAPIVANAIDVDLNGITYTLDESTQVATVKRCSSDLSGEITIPSKVVYNSKTYSVTSIGNEAFYKCSGLTSITIPNSVTSIGSLAFYGCI